MGVEGVQGGVEKYELEEEEWKKGKAGESVGGGDDSESLGGNALLIE